jgi:SAM-dependent methyltransferase
MGDEDGGYDEGYRAVPCFWGEEPGSLVREFLSVNSANGLRVLDLGAGEGKNASALARAGAIVDAVELSSSAIENGIGRFGDGFNWIHADVRTLSPGGGSYDLIVNYGLAHCMDTEAELDQLLAETRSALRPAGHYILVAFNARSQDLRAHPGFEPLLMPHEWYLSQFEGWDFIHESDTILNETHPHNNVPHHHSMTRLMVRKPR